MHKNRIVFLTYIGVINSRHAWSSPDEGTPTRQERKGVAWYPLSSRPWSLNTLFNTWTIRPGS